MLHEVLYTFQANLTLFPFFKSELGGPFRQFTKEAMSADSKHANMVTLLKVTKMQINTG